MEARKRLVLERKQKNEKMDAVRREEQVKREDEEVKVPAAVEKSQAYKEEPLTSSKSISHQEFECIVCTEIPLVVKETQCCGAIICEECGQLLKICPQRCSEEEIRL